MYLCGPGKHNCQPFCGPEGRFYCSDSVCSLWPAPFSYLCVSVRILCVCWKLSAAEQVKTDCCHTPAVVSTLLTPLPVSCPLTTPLHYIWKSVSSVQTITHAHHNHFFKNSRLYFLFFTPGNLRTDPSPTSTKDLLWCYIRPLIISNVSARLTLQNRKVQTQSLQILSHTLLSIKVINLHKLSQCCSPGRTAGSTVNRRSFLLCQTLGV